MFLPSYAESARGVAVRPISPSGTEVTGSQWLFVIGVDTYIHWPRLKTAVNDAKSVRDVLLSRYHFDQNHLIELYDEQATRKNILGKLRFLAEKVRNDDSLVIFYAGHGHLDSITREGSWIPVEGGTKDVSAWISSHDIKNYLRIDAIKAKHILLISDSCFSGDFFRGHRGNLPKVTDDVIKRAYGLTSRQAITSGGLEPVSDAGFADNSVFSHFLIKTLKRNQKPFLVPSDLFPDIAAGVAENAEQFPRFGSLTGTGGQQGRELVFFLEQGSRLKALSAEGEERKEELERLKRLEMDAEEANQKEAEEIRNRERELADLDAKIKEMKERLGTKAEKAGDSLDVMLALVRQKEEQQRPFEELKRRRQEEEAKRLAEIERLRVQEKAKRIAALEDEIRKYQEIISSPYGKDMKASAWKALVAKYPESAKGLGVGDTEGLFRKAFPGYINSIGMEFVPIPAGTFTMGSPSDEPGRQNDETQHRVSLSNPFYLQATEVTQGQWEFIMGNNPSYFENCGNDCPVEGVSWSDCQEFIGRLNQKEKTNKYRLPTEAEWEYAARSGGKKEKYAGGSDVDRLAWHDGNSGGSTHPVGTKEPNGLGLYDMTGNVWEWCSDWYGMYPKGSVTNPKGALSGPFNVLRGGCWNVSAGFCRSALRDRMRPDLGGGSVGFRVASDF